MNERRDWNVCLQVITRDGSTKLHRVSVQLLSKQLREVNTNKYDRKWAQVDDFK